jgi:hypothetical protein
LAPQPELSRAVRNAAAEQVRHARYQLAQLEATRYAPRRNRMDRFDESGRPVPPSAGLTGRLMELLRAR